jgi:hypothetical protein
MPAIYSTLSSVSEVTTNAAAPTLAINVNLTHVVTTNTTALTPAIPMVFNTINTAASNVANATTTTLPPMHTTSSTSSTSLTALSSTEAPSVWLTPVIVGVVLAIMAIVVGIPSAILAVKKLRRRGGKGENAVGTPGGV